MQKFSKFVVNHSYLILIISLIMIIPAIIGYSITKTNYDILVYLPSDIETLKGQNILKDDFNMGAFSVSLIDNKVDDKELVKLENKIRDIDCVTNVLSINDITGTTIPIEMIPKKILDHLATNESKLLLITFKTGTSDEETTNAIEKIEHLSSNIKVGGMSAMSLDMRKLVESQTFIYVLIAVVFCLLVLMISLDSYIVPILLLGNIGISILFNMGSNIMFGEISYITKAIAAVLQLGVTTDFSIFLYHKYEAAKKKNKSNKEAMSDAINETMVSVVGSSLTTIAGFLALCSMKFGLGKDIGLVMAKGVVFGVITVLSLYPSLLLIFDKWIKKTKHKAIIPKFKFVSPIVTNAYKWIFVVFVILLIPAYLSQKNTNVYYKLDNSIPDDYDYSIVSKKLKNEYGLISQSIILVNSNISSSDMNEMVNKLEKIDGVDSIISTNIFNKYGISDNIIPLKIKNILETKKYKLMLVNSSYEIASDELNEQITNINSIIKSYDKNAILAGEGALMNDLVKITATDFKNVNYVSIAVIFLIMFFVLKSLSLPILLVTAIEFAIFINMGVPYWKNTSIPFVSSIVIGTIQLGATIDYAILLTTKYIEERKKGIDKKKAMDMSLSSSVSSIFVSAMCFFAATFAVYIVSKIDMIGSLCLLMARGAIISMLVVMFIVPSVLLIFDKLIIKTTLGFKKGKNMKKFVICLTLLCCILFQMPMVNALSKDETVYTKLNEKGESQSIFITEHLYNFNKKDVIDKTKLDNIKNLNGNENFTLDGSDIIWENKGNDIYYQGTYQKDLPISLNVKYYLNGEEKEINDILGKKGNIKIVLTYSNNSYKNMNINGNIQKVYTPYAIVTTTILNNSDNKKINVKNGKVIDNGISSIVIGISSPGLYDSLKLSELKDINKVEISYDTDCFELNSIYSLATTNLFSDNNINIFEKTNDLYKSINLLQDNMNIIVDASVKLSDGTKQMNDGVTLLNSKVQYLTEKYKYYTGQDKSKLKEELIKIVEKNINKITPALEEEITNETSKIIKENKEELEKSVIIYTKKNTKKVIDEEVNKVISKLDINNLIEKTINSNLYNLLKNDNEINNLTIALKENINKEIKNIIENEYSKINSNIDNNMSKNEEYINNIAEKYGITYEQASQLIGEVQTDTVNQIKNNINELNIPQRIINDLNDKNYINNTVEKYVKELNDMIISSINNDSSIKEYTDQLKEKIITAIKEDLKDESIYLNFDIKNYISNLVDKIIDNTASDLSSKYTEDYTNQVVKNVIEKEFSEKNVDSKLRKELDIYEDDINKKMSILDETVNNLSDSINKLNDGTKQISNGMSMLSEGLSKYNKEGINKISNLVNGNVKLTQKRIDALIRVSNENMMIDDSLENTKRNSKMIFMIDSISKKEKDVNKVKKDVRDNSFWSKVKGLFD